MEAALTAYNKSIDLDKNNSDSMYRSALLYNKNGNLNKAKKIQRSLLVIDEIKGLELAKSLEEKVLPEKLR